jgi:3-dehydroquinate dehydratase-2
MNPAGFSYSGHALRDAILGCDGLPYIEVHISNLEKRGMKSALAPAAVGVIAGFGLDSYRLGLEAMMTHLKT